MASCKLISELTGIALKSMNRDKYFDQLGHLYRTKNIQNKDRNAPSHLFSIT